ncbi:MAG: hypothetical protein LUC83_04510, partial [Clostridiales bacterium]|nr:hypothetical protein [Clostridiales bacterium]
MKKRIRRILSGVLCAAVMAAAVSPKSVSVAETDSISDVSVQSSLETDTDIEVEDDEIWTTGTSGESGSAIENGESADRSLKDESGSGASTGTGMGADVDANTDTDADLETGMNADTDAVTDANADTSTNMEADMGTDTESAADTGTNPDTDSYGEPDTGNDSTVEESDGMDETEDPSGELMEETETLTEALADSLLALAAAADDESGLNMNKSYVSALTIKSLIDGTAPFDGDDSVGNDSGAGNRIVRTFDYVNYTLEYTTALMDPAETVDEAYLMAEFTLSCDPSVAEFNTETLNWCMDQVITYVYTDGSSSTSWDSGRTVAEQVLTGKRYLSKSGDANAIPGTGTLSVGVYVKAAKNGDLIQPEFTVWMEGNEESLFQSVQSEGIKVSAEPRYNINLVRNGSCSYLAYFDMETGAISETDTDGSMYGRLEGYALGLQLYNTSADKGLKGIELPTGEITFDLIFTETLNGTDVSADEDYT